MGENLDALFVTGGLAAEETGTRPAPAPIRRCSPAYLAAVRGLAPKLGRRLPALAEPTAPAAAGPGPCS